MGQELVVLGIIVVLFVMISTVGLLATVTALIAVLLIGIIIAVNSWYVAFIGGIFLVMLWCLVLWDRNARRGQ